MFLVSYEEVLNEVTYLNDFVRMWRHNKINLYNVSKVSINVSVSAIAPLTLERPVQSF